MRLTRIGLASAGVLVLMLALLPRAAVRGAQGSPPTSSGDHVLAIGVVNISYVVHNMQETKAADADAHAQENQFMQEQQRREQEIKDLYKKRENSYKPDSDQWWGETKAIDKLTAEADSWVATSKREFERQQKRRVKIIYDHITAAAAAVAQRHHLNLVIADESPDIGPDLDRITPQALQQVLANRAVLYSDKKADITEEVLTQVAATYAKQNPSNGTASLPHGK